VVAFLDDPAGPLCEAPKSPRGTEFSGTTDWTQNQFEVVAPEEAVAADVRIFINGSGEVYVKQMRFFQ
jgi:hypothetical protein